MRIYVVDNGGQWTHREWRVLRDIGVDTKIVPNTAEVSSIADAAGVVLSGGAPRISSEIKKLGNVGTYIDKLDVPVLGICVGHQYLAMHFGGDAGPADIPAYGKNEIHIDTPCELFEGIPERFTAWESHNDEVKVVPGDFEVLAHSETCRVEAMRHKKRRIYGVQFHPEVEHTEFGIQIFQNFVKICSNR
jgi:GMP synthase (glutamine-hydrolysing)